MATLSDVERQRLGTVRPELLRQLLELKGRMSQSGYATEVSEHGGFRSHELQAALYADSLAQGGGVLAYPVATPGHSRHEYGAAFDLHITGVDDDSFAYAIMASLGESVGLTAGYRFSDPDPFHFQLDETLDESIAAWQSIAPAATFGGVALLVAAAALWLLSK